MGKYHYYALNKPFGYLSQFTQDHPGQKTLSELMVVPKDVYPIGRLDKDSEGLLLLSNDKSINRRLLHPSNNHKKIYYAQVDGTIDQPAIDKLCIGVEIQVKKETYTTLPCRVKLIESPELWDRDPPIRVRKNIPTSWIEIILQEGKNRQVRKMLAAVGFPVLRLVRVQIEDLILDCKLGSYSEIQEIKFKALLKL